METLRRAIFLSSTFCARRVAQDVAEARLTGDDGSVERISASLVEIMDTVPGVR